MIKIIGGIIICLSTYAMGLKKSALIEQRLSILDEFEKSLVLLKGEIKYAQESLPEAVSNVGQRTTGIVKQFYNTLLDGISDGIELEFRKIWDENVNKCFTSELVSAEDINVISQLGGQLGHLDIEMQIRALDLCLNKLKERKENAIKDINEKSKLYRTVGLASGALITLVMF